MSNEPITALQEVWQKREAAAKQFGNRVQHYRRKAGLSQIKAAQQSRSMSLATWRATEIGNTNPLATYLKALGRLQAIASAVGCTLEELTNCG